MTAVRLECGLALIAAVACGERGSAADRPAESASANQASPAWTVRPDGFGAIPLGAPVADVVAALRDSLPIDLARLDGCAFARTSGMPVGTSLMVLRDSAGKPVHVDRVDVDSGGVKTSEGAGVGDTEASVTDLYRGRIQVQPHKYTGPTGHYLVVQSVTDTLHRTSDPGE